TAAGHEYLAPLHIDPLFPDDDNAHAVLHIGDRQRAGEIPLAFVAASQFLAVGGRDTFRQLVSASDFTFPLQLAVGFQVADVATRPFEAIFLGVDVVQILGIAAISVDGEV